MSASGLLRPHLFDEVLEPDHVVRCLNGKRRACAGRSRLGLTPCFCVQYTDPVQCEPFRVHHSKGSTEHDDAISDGDGGGAGQSASAWEPRGAAAIPSTSLKAQKAYKDANDLYKGSDWKGAAARYEYVLAARSRPRRGLLLPRQQLRQPLQARRAPARPQNDAYIQKAIENYRKAAEQDKNPEMKKLALQYLVAAYGPDKLNDPDPGRADRPAADRRRIRTSRPTTSRCRRCTKTPAATRKPRQALLKAREIKPNDPGVYTTISGFYNRQGEFDKTMEALHKAADLEPNNPQGAPAGRRPTTTRRQQGSSSDRRRRSANTRMKGIEASDKALALNAELLRRADLQEPAPAASWRTRSKGPGKQQECDPPG